MSAFQNCKCGNVGEIYNVCPLEKQTRLPFPSYTTTIINNCFYMYGDPIGFLFMTEKDIF